MSSLLHALIGEYRVTESLGAGGMGEVYKAVHTHLGRVIAIKVLLPDLADGPSLQRFYGEAGIQASLKHTGVAEYLGFYEFQGRPCILMEFVDGETLAAMIRRHGSLPLQEAVRIVREIAAVAASFHAQGVVHRDLKSNNVKINSAGQVKILDFGIARQERSHRLTRIGAVIGTPAALAPEQVRGMPTTPATDVWQLGALLYELLTGRLPFQAATEQEMYARILAADYLPAGRWQPSVPPGVEKIVSRCLQADVTKRYATARELCDALCEWELGMAAPPAGIRRGLQPAWWRFVPAVGVDQARRAQGSIFPDVPAARRRLMALALTGLASAALLIAIAAGVRGWNHGPPPPPPVVANPLDPRPLDTRTVTVDTMDGVAQVFRGEKLVGATPYRIQAQTGEKIELVLRREGCKDLPLQFEASERHNYTYTMERLKGQ
jgi:predicted Ser/Thr protein kinase